MMTDTLGLRSMKAPPSVGCLNAFVGDARRFFWLNAEHDARASRLKLGLLIRMVLSLCETASYHVTSQPWDHETKPSVLKNGEL